MTQQNQVQEKPKTQEDLQNRSVTYQVNGEEVKLSPKIIRDFLVSGNGNVTDQEITMFLQLCRYQKLNPFLNEAYLVKFGSQPASLIVSKEAFMKRAESHPQYGGLEAGIIVARNGEMIDLEGAVKLPDDELIGAWTSVHRKDRERPIKVRIAFAEFSKGQATWKQQPMNMIRKSAVVNALREAFPEALGAMYTEDDTQPTNDTAPAFEAQQEVDEKANQKHIDIQPVQEVPQNTQRKEVNVQNNEDFVQQQPEPVQVEENPFDNQNVGQMTIDNDPGF